MVPTTSIAAERALCTCLAVLGSSTYHASFVQLLHQQVAANVFGFAVPLLFWPARFNIGRFFFTLEQEDETETRCITSE